MKELIGHTIKKIELSEDAEVMAFTIEDGSKLYYVTEGDCCSETWFSAVNGLSNIVNVDDENPNYGKPGPVTDVIERPEISGVTSTRQEFDRLYGYFILVKWGGCEIEFRNSSNGYYGGSCYFNSFMDESKVKFRQLTQDF